MRMRSTVILAGGVALLASAGALVVLNSSSSAAEPRPTGASLPTVAVERDTLTATTSVDGTLGFRGAYEVSNGLVADGHGVLTQLAAVGETIESGDILYTLDGSLPAVLLEGDVPAWRDLDASVSDGIDVKQLEAALSELGFGSDELDVDQHWDQHTTAAVKRWQDSLDLAPTGAIPFGQVVFIPDTLRITARAASPGAPVQPGMPLLEATSTDPVIRVNLDTALQGQVNVGDPVTITLPGGTTVDGRVAQVATVATLPRDGQTDQGQGEASPTIAVEVSLDDSSATGRLDGAPVSVNITTDTAGNVLSVPVTALVATEEGGYAVQVVEDGEVRRVDVELGLFAGGLVEVTGPGLAEGDRVVVAR